MKSENVTRPQAPDKKIHSKNEFELCYLRHKYFRKSTWNPTKDEMEPYLFIIKNLARNTYYTYTGLLSMIGMDLDDVINIGRVHLVSYMNLFSINSSEDRTEKFKDTFFNIKGYPPNFKEIQGKDFADFTSFLRQRFEDLIRVCRQKGRNIKGCSVEEYLTYKGPNSPPDNQRDLIDHYERYGFKKIDQATFRTARKRAHPDSNVFEFNGFWYVAVLNTEQRNLEIEDLAGAGLDPYDNIHNMTPEQFLSKKLGESNLKTLKEQFDGYSKEMKINTIKTFILKNSREDKFASEIATAYKLLESLET